MASVEWRRGRRMRRQRKKMMTEKEIYRGECLLSSECVAALGPGDQEPG